MALRYFVLIFAAIPADARMSNQFWKKLVMKTPTASPAMMMQISRIYSAICSGVVDSVKVSNTGPKKKNMQGRSDPERAAINQPE